MSLKTEVRELDGIKFHINQFPARKCKKLEIRTIKILAPLLNILEGVKSLDSDIDMGNITKSIKEILMNVDEDVFDQYMMDMVESTTAEIPNSKDKEQKFFYLKDEKSFDFVFIGKGTTIYKLLVEIMKVNKMFFFELLGGGGLNLTGIFSKVISDTKD